MLRTCIQHVHSAWTVCCKYAYKMEELTAKGAYCDVGLVPGGVLPSPPGSSLGRAGDGESGGLWGLCPFDLALPVWVTASLPASACSTLKPLHCACLSCTYLAHHDLESVSINIVIVHAFLVTLELCHLEYGQQSATSEQACYRL